MSDRNLRLVLAVAVPIVAILVANWYDGSVLTRMRTEAFSTYDMKPFAYGSSLAYLLTAAGAAAIVGAAWRSRSPIVGLAYAVVGGFIAGLPGIWITYAIKINDQPAVLPDPIARFISDRYMELSESVTGSVFILGAVMFVSGIALIGAALSGRRMAPADATNPSGGFAAS